MNKGLDFTTNQALGRFAPPAPPTVSRKSCLLAFKDTPLQTLMESEDMSWQPEGWITPFPVHRAISSRSIQLRTGEDLWYTARRLLQILLPRTVFVEVWHPHLVCRYWFDLDGVEVAYQAAGTLHIYPPDQRRQWAESILRSYERMIILPQRTLTHQAACL